MARSTSSPKAAQPLGCSFTPGLRISFGRPRAQGSGQWVSYCCVALVFVSVFRGDAGIPGRGLGCVFFGHEFWLCPALPGWGSWCVRLVLGSAVTPPFLPGV